MRLTRLLTEEEIKLANDYSTNGERKNKQGDYISLKNVSPFDVENKLGQLEDIEDELGVDLVTLFKAFKNGIYVKLDGEIDYIQYVSIFKKRKWHLYSSSTFWGKYDIGLIKDYGKTWALTKEELEK